MQKIISKVVNFFNKVWSKEYVRAFVYIYLLVLACLSLKAARNNFTLPLTADYAMQTYAFYSQGYKIFWNFVTTGEYPLFDFSNYLGANYLGTQSFYYVFSPLFYLLCLWPAKYLYQGIFFHMVFKYALGGFFMYVLLRRYFHVSFKMSWVGGFIYALSGWSLFYLWFHFGDAMAFFPLFIIGIERLLKERKGGVLAIGTFLCAMSNYFLFVNFIVFGVFYALYRWIYIYGINKKRGFSAKERWGVLLQGICYAACGCLLAGICLFPSLHVISSMSRNQTSKNYLLSLLEIFFVNPTNVDGIVLGELKAFKDIVSVSNIGDLLETIFIWKKGNYGPSNINVGYMLANWLFMNTNCWDSILFDQSSLDNSIGGMFITTPLTMLLIPSIVKAVKTKRPWTIFGVISCLILPFIPLTAHAAFAFSSIYGRWQIWIVLIGIIFIIPTLDKFEEVDKKWITVNLVFNYLLATAAFVIAIDSGKLPTTYVKNFLGMEIPGLVLIAIAELVVMLLVWAVYRMKFIKAPLVKNIAIIIVIIEIAASSFSTVSQKGYHTWSNYYLSQPQYAELEDTIEELQANDNDEFYRIMNTESNRSFPNLPSQLNYNGAATFNSTYDFELDDFKHRSRMAYSGSWMMGNHEKRYWLDQYIGTKYYIIDKKDINNDNIEAYRDQTLAYDGRTSFDQEQQDYKLNLSWNYKKVKDGQYVDVYENQNFIGVGYTVDKYMISEINDPKSKHASYFEELYADTAIVESEDTDFLKKYSDAKRIDSHTEHESDIKTFGRDRWNYYFSPREDASYHLTNNYERQVYKLEKGYSFTESDISKLLPSNGQFFHKRWIGRQRYGDQIILELKGGKTKLAAEATPDNICYVNFMFRMGLKVLISFYNGDTLVTQDAHNNHTVSTHPVYSELKFERGFYLDQPVDKIVIEFIEDTQFPKLFYKGKMYNSTTERFFDCKYVYQNEVEQRQAPVMGKIFTDVKYKNNKFTFKGNQGGNKLAVTNIPYDDGWTLKVGGRERTILKVNGGFVGFVTLDGETEYQLSYFTPKLKLGLVSTGSGILLFIALYFVFRKTKSEVLEKEMAINKPIIEDLEKREEDYFKKLEDSIRKFILKIKDKINNKNKK